MGFNHQLLKSKKKKQRTKETERSRVSDKMVAIGGPSLKYFIRQATVLQLYRDFLKQSNLIKRKDLRNSISQEIKSQFRKNQHISEDVIPSLLSEAKR